MLTLPRTVTWPTRVPQSSSLTSVSISFFRNAVNVVILYHQNKEQIQVFAKTNKKIAPFLPLCVYFSISWNPCQHYEGKRAIIRTTEEIWGYKSMLLFLGSKSVKQCKTNHLRTESQPPRPWSGCVHNAGKLGWAPACSIGWMSVWNRSEAGLLTPTDRFPVCGCWSFLFALLWKIEPCLLNGRIFYIVFKVNLFRKTRLASFIVLYRNLNTYSYNPNIQKRENCT